MTTTVVDAGAKKLHLAHEMRVVDGGDESGSSRLVATEEIMTLHVSTASGRSAPFPDDVADTIAQYRGRGLEPPDWTGRRIGT